MRRNFFFAGLMVMAALTAMAQDPVKVDSKHYKLEMENSQVRVLRINYGPHEKSVMHEHPASVAVMLTDADVKFTMADGKTDEIHVKAGQVMWREPGTHLPENLGGKPFALILVELKARRAPAKPAAKPAPPK